MGGDLMDLKKKKKKATPLYGEVMFLYRGGPGLLKDKRASS